MVGNAFEHMPQVCLGVDAVELGASCRASDYPEGWFATAIFTAIGGYALGIV